MTPDGFENFLKQLGNRVRWLRQHQATKLSIEGLALRAGLNPGHVGQLERGQTTVSLETLCKIANALHVSLSELVAFGSTPGDELLVREVVELVKARPVDERADVVAIFRQIAHLGRKPERRTRKPRRG